MADFSRITARRITTKTIRIKQIDAIESEQMFDEQRWTLDTASAQLQTGTVSDAPSKPSEAQGGSAGNGHPYQTWTIDTVHHFNNFNGSRTEPETREVEPVPQEQAKPLNGKPYQAAPIANRRRIAEDVQAKADAHPDRFQGLLIYAFGVNTPLALNDDELAQVHQLVSTW